MIPLVRKVDRRLEAGGQIEQRAIDLPDLLRQRPLELIERRASLKRRRRRNQICHCFGLRKIDPPVQKRAQRELAGFGEPGPAHDGRRHDLAQHHRTAMRAQLHHIVSRIRPWRREVRGNDVIELHSVACGGAVGTHDRCERGVARLERFVGSNQAPPDRVSVGAAQPHDPNPAVAWRSCDRDDGVRGGKHC